ncbi:MAG: hypothetical protein JXB07_19395, partial [Anaerolineae bacterium]|nr:hypothetical protein [Anaerolineae bacterium]
IVVFPEGLGGVAGVARIEVDALDLVGAVEYVADGLHLVGRGVPLIEAELVAGAGVCGITPINRV